MAKWFLHRNPSDVLHRNGKKKKHNAYMEAQRSWMTKTQLKNKNKQENHCWRLEVFRNQPTNYTYYDHLIFDKSVQIGEKTASPTNGAGKSRYPYVEKEKLNLYLSLHIKKINLKQIKGLAVRPETLKELGETLQDRGLGKGFLKRIRKSPRNKSKD